MSLACEIGSATSAVGRRAKKKREEFLKITRDNDRVVIDVCYPE